MSLRSPPTTFLMSSKISGADLPYSMITSRLIFAFVSSTISASTPFVLSAPPRPSWMRERTLPFMSMMPSIF